MERNYELFVNDDDNVTALDDILNASERQDWNFKSDVLNPVYCKSEAVAEDADSISETLCEITYLHEYASESETIGSNIPSSESFSLESLHSTGNLYTIHEDQGNASSSESVSRVDDSYGAEPLTPLSSCMPPYLDGDQVPSNNTLMSNALPSVSETNLEQRIKSIQNCFVENLKVVNNNRACDGAIRKEVQKPPTTAGIGLEDLKAVFHLERPKAEKKLCLKRTTFSNLSRHYGISKWPFRTIRDAMNRMQANSRMLKNRNISEERQRKLCEQQRLLAGVINLIYSHPHESRDSNTLAVLLRIVAARESPSKFSEI